VKPQFLQERKMKYRMIDKKPLYHGFFHVDAYTVEHDTVAGGRQRITREHLERGDAVAVLLYDSQYDEVLLLEQFRIGPAVRGENPWLTEIVAGIVDAGELPEVAAIRECEEEAGYRPRHLLPLGHYYATPGGSSERLFLFLGEVDKDNPSGPGGGQSDEQEDIRLRWVRREQAMAMVHQGSINSGAPMMALLLAFGCKPALPVSGKTRKGD